MATATGAEVDRVRGLLQAAGHAWTRPRSGVLHVLGAAATPLRVEEIHERLGRRPAGRGINLSSVYRTVKLLHALGIARRVQLGDGAQRYELADGYRAHHHHFVCEVCGRIEDVRGCPVQGANLGVAVRSHSLELSGLCRRCAPRGALGDVRG